MGGRGTYAVGRDVEPRWKTIGEIEGVSIVQKINIREGNTPPEESHTSKEYIVLHKDGTFRCYRKYNDDHTAAFDIEYHPEHTLNHSSNPMIHIHFYDNDGKRSPGRLLTEEEYSLIKKFFTRSQAHE